MSKIIPNNSTSSIDQARIIRDRDGALRAQVIGFNDILNLLQPYRDTPQNTAGQNGGQSQAGLNAPQNDLQDPAFLLLNRGGSLKQKQLEDFAKGALNKQDPLSLLSSRQNINGLSPDILSAFGIQPSPQQATQQGWGQGNLFSNTMNQPVNWGGNMYTQPNNNQYIYPVSNWPAWPTYASMQASPLMAGNLMSLPQLQGNISMRWNNYALPAGSGNWAN